MVFGGEPEAESFETEKAQLGSERTIEIFLCLVDAQVAHLQVEALLVELLGLLFLDGVGEDG